MLSTSTKIRIARALLRLTLAARWMVGSSKKIVTCRRGGVVWELDLTEGIDLQIFLLGTFEPRTDRTLRRIIQPGMTILDVGANMGAHTLPSAVRVGKFGRVIAVEPTIWAFDRLQKNVSINPKLKDRIRCIRACLTSPDRRSRESFYASWNLLRGEKDAHPVHKGYLSDAKCAPAMTLDDLVQELGLGHIHLIKLDVDGFEFEILQGAKSVLQKFSPQIVLEVCPYTLHEQGASVGDLIKILHECGYGLFDLSGRKRLDESAEELEKKLKNNSRNTLALQQRHFSL